MRRQRRCRISGMLSRRDFRRKEEMREIVRSLLKVKPRPLSKAS